MRRSELCFKTGSRLFDNTNGGVVTAIWLSFSELSVVHALTLLSSSSSAVTRKLGQVSSLVAKLKVSSCLLRYLSSVLSHCGDYYRQYELVECIAANNLATLGDRSLIRDHLRVCLNGQFFTTTVARCRAIAESRVKAVIRRKLVAPFRGKIVSSNTNEIPRLSCLLSLAFSLFLSDFRNLVPRGEQLQTLDITERNVSTLANVPKGRYSFYCVSRVVSQMLIQCDDV